MRILTKEEALSFLLTRADNCDSDHTFVIAIDGRSASGKTTFASELGKSIDANIIHTDDFFRPRNKKGEIEMSDFCGNFDVERFKREAVEGIKGSGDFSIGIFDCKKGEIIETVTYNRERIIIVEGAYACLPDLEKYWDVALFFDIDTEEQQKRILLRDGNKALESYNTLWLPAEERYISKYSINNLCDAVVRI